MSRTMNGGIPAVSFAKLPDAMPMPNMLDVQLRAFQNLLQVQASAEDRLVARDVVEHTGGLRARDDRARAVVVVAVRDSRGSPTLR